MNEKTGGSRKVYFLATVRLLLFLQFFKAKKPPFGGLSAFSCHIAAIIRPKLSGKKAAETAVCAFSCFGVPGDAVVPHSLGVGAPHLFDGMANGMLHAGGAFAISPGDGGINFF